MLSITICYILICHESTSLSAQLSQLAALFRTLKMLDDVTGSAAGLVCVPGLSKCNRQEYEIPSFRGIRHDCDSSCDRQRQEQDDKRHCVRKFYITLATTTRPYTLTWLQFVLMRRVCGGGSIQLGHALGERFHGTRKYRIPRYQVYRPLPMHKLKEGNQVCGWFSSSGVPSFIVGFGLLLTSAPEMPRKDIFIWILPPISVSTKR